MQCGEWPPVTTTCQPSEKRRRRSKGCNYLTEIDCPPEVLIPSTPPEQAIELSCSARKKVNKLNGINIVSENTMKNWKLECVNKYGTETIEIKKKTLLVQW